MPAVWKVAGANPMSQRLSPILVYTSLVCPDARSIEWSMLNSHKGPSLEQCALDSS
jgi:hypothetical protein